MGLISEVLGGPSQKVSKEGSQGAERRALLDFGLGLLSQSAGGAGTNFGTAVAVGAMAGRQSFDDFINKQAARESLDRREQIMEQGLATSDEVLQGLLGEALKTGDNDTARTITQLLQMKAASGSKNNLVMKEFDNHLMAINPQTGQIVAAYAPTRGGQLSDQERDLIWKEYGDHDSRTATLAEIPQQYSRVAASASALLESYQDGTVTDEDVQLHGAALISSFARLIDPGSVVRSEEMKFLLGQGSLIDWVQQKLEGAKTGRMTEDLTRAFLKEAGLQLNAQYENFTNLTDLSRSRLTAPGIEIPEEALQYYDPFADQIKSAREIAEAFGWSLDRDNAGHEFDTEEARARARARAREDDPSLPQDRELTQEELLARYPVVVPERR